MWWTAFTAVDLYIGLVILDVMASSVPPHKLGRLRATRNVVIGLLAASVVIFAVQVVRRYR
jgi:hypothetical protein